MVVYNRLLYSPWTCDSVTARHGEPPAGHLPGQLVDFHEEYVNLTEIKVKYFYKNKDINSLNIKVK